MNSTSPLDRLLNIDWKFAVGAVIVAGIWFVATRSFGSNSVVRRYPQVAAGIEIVLTPVTIVLIGRLMLAALEKTGSSGFNDEIQFLISACVYLATARCVARFIEVWILSKSKLGSATSLPELQRGLLYAFAYFIALSIFLSAKGFSFTGVYLSTGAVAAIAAFAMQQTLGDLFSGIALSIEKSFRLGDWIALSDGTEGEVIDIDWRSTSLRGWDNTTFIIPNGVLAREAFKNLHGPDHLFAPWYEIKIPAEIDPKYAKALLSEAASRCENILKDPPPGVRLVNASTVPYTYMIWVNFPNYPAMFEGREELYREVHQVLKESGIHVAPEIHEIRSRKAEITKAEPPNSS